MTKKKEKGATGLLDKYVYMDSAIDVLEMAFKNNTNVILHGPGGFGKSTLSMDFLKTKGIDPYVITMGSGMNTDRLFGGVDLKKFKETGKLEFLADNSFMNHEYVIFEELFDAPDFILEQLKDIISSGIFRNGDQAFKLKTKLIICNTNKTREQFAKNLSLQALMERFPLELEVRWKDYTGAAYENLLKCCHGNADPALIFILDKFAKEKHIISPRIALKANELISTSGLECLNYFADFATEEKLLKECMKSFGNYHKFTKLKHKLEANENKMKKYDILKIKSTAEVKEVAEILTEFKTDLQTLNNLKGEDEIITQKASLYKSYQNKMKAYKAQVDELLGQSAPSSSKGKAGKVIVEKEK